MQEESNEHVALSRMNPSDQREPLPPPPPLYSNTPQRLGNPAMQTINPVGSLSGTQSYGHIPVNPMPGPPYHKIAQPMRQLEPSHGQSLTFPPPANQQPYLAQQQQPPPQQPYPHQSYSQPPVYREQFQHSIPPMVQSGMPQAQYPPAQPAPHPSIQVVQDSNQYGMPYQQSHQNQVISIPSQGSPVKAPPTNLSQSYTSSQTVNANRPVQAPPVHPPAVPPQTEPQLQFSPQPSEQAPAQCTPPPQNTSPVKGNSVMPTPPSDSTPSEASDPASPEIKIKIKKTVSQGKPSLTSTLLSSEAPLKQPAAVEKMPTKRQLAIAKSESLAQNEVAYKPPTFAQRKDTAKAAKVGNLLKGPQLKQSAPSVDEKPCEWLVGDLVWSKVSGHPWWPCMVAYDPNLGIYTRMKGSIGKTYRMYHVQFFGEVPERGWVSGSSMKKFSGRDQYDSLVQEMVSKVRKAERSRMMTKLAVRPCRRQAWEAAIVECERALPMSRHERKLNFTFKYDMSKADSAAQSIDVVSLGDSPKMKAKRAYKKQREDEPNNESAAEANRPLAKTPRRQKEDRAAAETPKRKRGRKTAQFLEFSRHYKAQIVQENPGIGQREIYFKLEEKWSALSEQEKDQYATKSPSTPTTQKRERKRKLTPGQDSESPPVLKRSKRESKPSKKLQEADLSSLGYSPELTKTLKLKMEKTSEEQAKHQEQAPIPRGRSSGIPGKRVRSRKGAPAATPSQAETTPVEHHSKRKRSRKSEGQSKREESSAANKQQAITSDMSQDFAEMQEDDDEGGLIIDTDLIAGAIQSAGDTNKSLAPAHSAASSEADAASQNGSSTTSSVSGSSSGRDRSAPGGGAAKKENVCQVCERPGQLLLCEGGCCGAFHLDCIGLQMAPSGSFKCDECISGVHSCYECKQSDQNVKRCHVPVCGKYYHESCIRQFPLTKFDHRGFTCPLHSCHACFAENPKSAKSTRGRLMRCVRCPTAYHQGETCVAAGSIVLAANSIVCSRHFQPLKSQKHHSHVSVSWCFTCSSGGDLICCESCPAAYHPKCLGYDSVPEGNWFCRDCINGKRPRYGDIIWVKLGNYRWWPGMVCNPKDVPQNIQEKTHQVGEFPVKFFGSNDYFWTHKGRVFDYLEGDKGSRETTNAKGLAAVFKAALKEASERYKQFKASKEQKIAKELENSSKKPAPFKFIKTNRPVGNVVMPAFDISQCQACECTLDMDNPCGPDVDCLNRMLLIECHPQVCPAKEKCQNQRFQKRLYPDSVPLKTSQRGWGLVSMVDIKKGDFVNEYVGELVDEEACRRRIKKAHDENITDFYFLTLDKDRIIDAGPKGNLSRFMNHSCQPNCETQKWTVNGDTRVGLFAIRNITAGAELSFNYNLDCLGNEKKKCECGAPNCSGFIGVRPKTAAAAAQEEKSKQAKDKKRKRVRKRNRAGPPKLKHEDECFRCGEGGELIMCDVKTCPKSYHLDCLGLVKHPYGKWQCPWHHCDICGKASVKLCVECPNSFCKIHSENVTVIVNERIFCKDHDLAEVQKAEEERMRREAAKLEQEVALLSQQRNNAPVKREKRKYRRRDKSAEASENQPKARRKNKLKKREEKRARKRQNKAKDGETAKKEEVKEEEQLVNGVKAEEEEKPAEDVSEGNGLQPLNSDSEAELVIDEGAAEKREKAKKEKQDKLESNGVDDAKEIKKHKKKEKKEKKEKKHKKNKEHKKEKKAKVDRRKKEKVGKKDSRKEGKINGTH
ncbi:histone-lysine N-methyltransferase NSD2-like [Diadema antillarum]|uniref:histone-lysine N-methyltransferase NSD2-like n=1 Tax=Diadema antillarum TaxID=105358 RepID=UPI003A84FC6B